MPSYCLTATCTAEQRAKHTAESQRSKQHLKTLQAAGLRLPSSSAAGQRARPAGRNRMASSSSAEHYRQLARECLQIAQTFPLVTAAIPFWTWRESGGVWPISKSTRPICEGIGSFSWRLRAARTGSGQNRRLRARVIAGRPGKRARRAAAWGTGGQNDGQA